MAVFDFLKAYFAQDGRESDQYAIGSKRAGGSLALSSTDDAVKGPIQIGKLVYDELHHFFGNLPEPLASLHFQGRIRIDSSFDPQFVPLEIDSLSTAPTGTPTSGFKIVANGTQYYVPLYPLGGGPAKAKPTVSVTANPDHGFGSVAQPLSVAFSFTDGDVDDSISTGTINFGDGTTETISNPQPGFSRTHSFTAPLGQARQFVVTWQVWSTGPPQIASDIASIVITVTAPSHANPDVALTATPNSGNAPLNGVQLVATTTLHDGATLTQGTLDLGDGSATIPLSNPGGTVTRTHDYPNVGNYQATWSVTDSLGGTGFTYVNITVGQPPQNQAPVVSLGVSPNVITAGQTTNVTFTATDADDLVTFGEISFGDTGIIDYNDPAGIQASRTLQHQYNTPANYTLSWFATDSRGLSSQKVTASLTVQAVVPKQLPTATIIPDATSKSETSPGAGATFTFTLNYTVDSTLQASTGVFDPKDGSAVKSFSLPVSGQTWNKLYLLPSGETSHTFLPTWTVTDSTGQSVTAATNVTLAGAPQPQTPTVTLSVSPSEITDSSGGGIATTISCTAAVSGSTIDFGDLDFGDGTTEHVTSSPTTVSRSHTYHNTTGADLTRTVKWQAHAANGLSSTQLSFLVLVHPQPIHSPPFPQISSSATVTPPNAGDTVTANFTASVFDGATLQSGLITWGDGATTSLSSSTTSLASFSKTHVYTTAGTYFAFWTVTDSRSSTGTSNQIQIRVGTPAPKQPPTGDIVANPNNGNDFGSGLNVQFTLTSSDPNAGGSISRGILYLDVANPQAQIVFDNPTSPVSPAPSNAYTAAQGATAQYTARWWIQDNFGQTFQKDAQISVIGAPYQKPVVSIDAVQKSGLAPFDCPMNFHCSDPNAGGHITSGTVEFADGVQDFPSSTELLAGSFSRTHRYQTPGSYVPRFTVADNFGQSNNAQLFTIDVIAPAPPPSQSAAIQFNWSIVQAFTGPFDVFTASNYPQDLAGRQSTSGHFWGVLKGSFQVQGQGICAATAGTGQTLAILQSNPGYPDGTVRAVFNGQDLGSRDVSQGVVVRYGGVGSLGQGYVLLARTNNYELKGWDFSNDTQVGSLFSISRIPTFGDIVAVGFASGNIRVDISEDGGQSFQNYFNQGVTWTGGLSTASTAHGIVGNQSIRRFYFGNFYILPAGVNP